MNRGGIGLPGILTVMFVVFKVFGVINWSWWWVFSPLWISAGMVAFILLLLVVFGIIDVVVTRWR